MNSNLVTILVWMVIIGVAFGFAWWKGYITQLSDYFQKMIEELKKCAWPTWDELKGSTVVVSIAIVLIGVFTYGVDTAFFYLVRLIT